jgi:hypothetical protein
MLLLPFAGSVFAQVDCDCEILPADEPVCVVVEGEFTLPLPNECIAVCLGFSTEDFIVCDFDTNPFPQDTTWSECECEIGEEEPICVLTDAVTGVTCPFPNLCFAECFGYTADDVVECDDFGWPGDSTNIEIPGWDCECEFGDASDYVCIEVDGGFTMPYPSLCFAECDGYTAADIVECGDFGGPVDSTNIEIPDWDCECELGNELDFVCIEVEEGFTMPYPSLCFAECDGFTAADIVECGDFGGPVDTTIINLDCDCEILPGDTPVCVEVEAGFTVTLPNQCFADCLELEVVECEDGLSPGGLSMENLAEIENDDEIESTGMFQTTKSTMSLKNVYPNPVTSSQLNLDIDVSNNARQDVEISITNIYGATLYTNSYVLIEGMNEIAIDVNNVDNGILFVNIISKDGVTSRKLVKH